MKNFTFLISIVALSTLYYFYQSNPKSELAQELQETLVVGISPDYPPYAQIDLETGMIVGLEVDVIREVARRLHKKLHIKDMPFNSLIIELLSGQIDIIAAGLCPSEERKKTILFSHTYIDSDNNVVISKKSNPEITKIEDLFDKHVAVNIGYTADTFLSKYPEIALVRLKTPADGFMGLQSDSVDAFVIAQSTYNKFLEGHQDHHNYQIFELPGSSDACALAYTKNNTQLQTEIDPVLDAMTKDGTMLAIQKKWGFA
jgi:ABC-type amino acid transport substrate-binding protein